MIRKLVLRRGLVRIVVGSRVGDDDFDLGVVGCEVERVGDLLEGLLVVMNVGDLLEGLEVDDVGDRLEGLEVDDLLEGLDVDDVGDLLEGCKGVDNVGDLDAAVGSKEGEDVLEAGVRDGMEREVEGAEGVIVEPLGHGVGTFITGALVTLGLVGYLVALGEGPSTGDLVDGDTPRTQVLPLHMQTRLSSSSSSLLSSVLPRRWPRVHSASSLENSIHSN